MLLTQCAGVWICPVLSFSQASVGSAMTLQMASPTQDLWTSCLLC